MNINLTIAFVLSTLPIFALPLNSIKGKQEIRDLYLQGEIDSVKIKLEASLLKNQFLENKDSIFAFKYLGTIFSSNDETKELGSNYFTKLLKLDSRSDLDSMYANSKTILLFNGLKSEYMFKEGNVDLKREIFLRDSLISVLKNELFNLKQTHSLCQDKKNPVNDSDYFEKYEREKKRRLRNETMQSTSDFK